MAVSAGFGHYQLVVRSGKAAVMSEKPLTEP